MRVLTGRTGPFLRPAVSMLAAVGMACLVAAPSSAAEDGIDCAKADQADETAICADPMLVREDARMAALFKSAMSRSGMGERGDLQDSQATWLDGRHACKAEAACLRATYASRIAHLQSVIDAAARTDDPF